MIDPTALQALLDAGSLRPWSARLGGRVVATYKGDAVADALDESDAALIVAAVNSLPALLREREALLAFVAEVEKQHYCPRVRSGLSCRQCRLLTRLRLALAETDNGATEVPE